MRDKHRGHVGVDDAACEDVGGPGGLTYRAGTAGTGNCGCWLEMVRLGSWRKCGVDREADLDPGVHTEQTRRENETLS